MGSIPFFLNFDYIEENSPDSIQARTTPTFWFLEKFSARVQIKTHTLPFFIKFDILKDTKPVKKRRENRSWAQWAMLARPIIFSPLLLG